MKKLRVIINGRSCGAEKGEILLDIASRNGIKIPTLCHNEVLRGQASCRICVVEVWEKGKKIIVTSCIYPVLADIEVKTNTEEIREIRKNLLRLLLSEAPDSPVINELAKEYLAENISRFKINREDNCIMCGLCVKACEEMGNASISTVNRGIHKKVTTPYEDPSATCIGCGSCAFVCPTNNIAMHENGCKREIWGKTFEMLECENCQKPYITKEQYDFINNKMGEKQERICEECKKKKYTKALVEIYR